MAGAIAGCATYSKVSEKRPRFLPVPGRTGALAKVEAEIVKALGSDHREPLAALGGYMTAAETALVQLRHDPQDQQALHDYKFAVGRIIGTIGAAKLDPWTQPLRVPTSSGEFLLTHKPDPRPQWNPALYNFTPADQFDIHGTYVSRRTTRSGLGAPVVAVGRRDKQGCQPTSPFQRLYYGVTAIARFEGQRCVLSFEDPLAEEQIRVDGYTYPVGGGFYRAARRDAREHQPEKTRTHAFVESGQVRRDRPYFATPALRSEQSRGPRHPWADGFARHLDADAQSLAWRCGYPPQLPVLVLQLSKRLPLSLFCLDPATRTGRYREAFSAAVPMVVIGQHGRLHQPITHHRHRRDALMLFNKPPEQVPLTPKQENLYRRPHLPAVRELDRVLHFCARRKRSCEELAWPDWLEPGESSLNVPERGQCRSEDHHFSFRRPETQTHPE